MTEKKLIFFTPEKKETPDRSKSLTSGTLYGEESEKLWYWSISKNSNTPNYCLDPYRYDPRREVHPNPPNLHMSSNHFNPHVLKPNSYHTQHVNRYQPQYVNHYNSKYVNNYHQQYQHRPRSEHSFGHYPSSHNPSPYNFHQHQVSPHHHLYNVPEHGQQYQHLINPQPHIHYNQFSQKKFLF